MKPSTLSHITPRLALDDFEVAEIISNFEIWNNLHTLKALGPHNAKALIARLRDRGFKIVRT